MAFDPFPPDLEHCTRCPRLVRHRQEVAQKKRRSYRNEDYWGRPVPGFGDPNARILLLGLAPGAHGSNRTGRMFTGDGSGNFLFPALWRTGFANQPDAEGRDDGMSLRDMWISAACRCVPPGNKPSRQEVLNCQPWLAHDFGGLGRLELVLALGSVAHESYLELLKSEGRAVVKARHKFAHGALHEIEGALPMLGSYHVSIQNTNTGKLTPKMFDDILERARELVGLPKIGGGTKP